MKRVRLLVVVLALVAAACGSDDGDAVDTGTTTATTSQPGSDSDAVQVIASTASGRAEPDGAAPTAELAAGFNDVGFDLLRTQDGADNAVLSPVSIGHAVLMARAAADEPTGTAIDTALALPSGMAAHDAWNAVDQLIAHANGSRQDINGDPTPIVTIADRIWPSQLATPDQDWVDLLATHHGADVATIDVDQPEASREAINAWVADATEDLITDLVPPGFIQPTTTLVLTDAVYFKAQWRTIFGKYGTAEADFHLLDGTTEVTTFMRDLEKGGARGIGDGWSAAELPYLGDDFSMLVIVPDEGNYDAVRDALSDAFLDEIDAMITPGPYELLLPQWENEAKVDLLPWLTEIGAAPGSYPGISPGSFLSGGVHAADIAVDEIGTVAAAATALGFDESGPAEPEFTLAADRPFLYVIRHDATGMVLFAGQVTNPNA